MIQNPDHAQFGKEQPTDSYDPVLPDLSELYSSVPGDLPDSIQRGTDSATQQESSVKPERNFLAHPVAYPDKAPDLSVTYFSPVGTGSLRNNKFHF
jgi:hypothetical protein